MPEPLPAFPTFVRPCLFPPDRGHFHRSVSDLLAARFDTSNLPVLASRNSLAKPAENEPTILPTELSGEIKCIAPSTFAGIILLSGGPVVALPHWWVRIWAMRRL